MIFISSRAPSWFLDLAEIPMLEPPANTGAGVPSMPGSTKVPNLASFQTRLPSFRSPIDQCAQLGAMIVAAARVVLPVTLSGLSALSLITSASLMYSHGDSSLAVLGAFEAYFWISCSCVRPLMEFGSDRVLVQVPLSTLARSPPLAKIHEMPLRQSWPPMKKPEKSLMWRGLSCATLVTAALNSSRVVGALTPAS